MTRLLVGALFYGLAATGLAALVRKAPWPATWLARKPLGCVVCMAGWSALIVTLLDHFVNSTRLRFETGLVWLAGTAVATYLLTQSGVFFSGPTDPLSDLTERDP